MANEIKISAGKRAVQGSSAARRLRRSGFIPAILSTLDGKSELLQLNAHDFEREISRHASAALVVSVEVDGSSRLALIRELQRDGLTGRITHADFGEVDSSKKMHVRIPLMLIGDPVGVRTENGVLEQQLRVLEVSCLPSDVIEDFTVDCSEMHVGDDIKVRDLQLDRAKYTLVTHEDQVVCNVSSAVEEVAAAAPAADAAAAPAAAPAAPAKK